MRQKDKQRNSEVMGQCSPAELLDKPLTHGSHPCIHPASQFWPFVTSKLYEPHPVSHSPGLTVTVGAWLTGVTGENVPERRAVSCLCSCDFNSRTQNGRRGGQQICHPRAMPREEPLLHCQSEIRDVLYSIQSHLLYLVSLYCRSRGWAVLYSVVTLITFNSL